MEELGQPLDRDEFVDAALRLYHVSHIYYLILYRLLTLVKKISYFNSKEYLNSTTKKNNPVVSNL